MSVFRTAFLARHLFRHRRAFAGLTAPRRPRHRLLRIALGLVGVALLLALLFLSVFVGIAMLAAGLLIRLAGRRGRPLATQGGSLDGDYRVIGKAQLPLVR